jgi:hypothetical protein
VANNGPRLDDRRVGWDRELQLHHATNRDWLGQDSAESALRDNEAVPVKVTLLVIANS